MSDVPDRWQTFHRRQTWMGVLLAAVVIAMVVAARNYGLMRAAGKPLPYWLVFLQEIPLWLTWVMLLPAIVAVSTKFPPLGQHAFRNGAIHVVTGFGMSLVAITALVFARSFLPGSPPVPLLSMAFVALIANAYFVTVLAFIFTYFSAVGLILAGRYYSAQQRQRERQSELEAMLARSELDVLRMQIHPHFLFNTMHAISAMMDDDVQGARRMMTRLSELLRLAIEEGAPHLVTLEEEMQLLHCYLDIQRIRFASRLHVEEDISSETLRCPIPRLLLQPIVENAIVHGVSRVEGDGRITINARSKDDMMVITVRDNGPGLVATINNTRERIGLSNSRSRLQHYFGNRATITVSALDGGAETRVCIPTSLLTNIAADG